MTATTTRIGELTERIRLERYAAGAWTPDSVLSAKVRAGPPPRVPEASEVSVAPAVPGERFEITLRYRSDLGDDARALRIRRGAQTLVVMQAVGDVDGDRRWSRLVCERFISYASRHDELLARVAAQGAAITFSKPTTSSNSPPTYDSPTDTPAMPPAVTVVTGRAMSAAMLGDLRRYVPNSSVETGALSLLFVPDTYGELPAEGATATFGSADVVVSIVNAISPNGVPIGAVIAMGR